MFLDIDVSKNENYLKLKVKPVFPLSMGLMMVNHSDPYIQSTSTTVLCYHFVLSFHYI